jgi:four helix bundle protein
MSNQGNKIKDFNDLEVWKKANSFAIRIYTITKGFPKDERFGLTDQIRRAASSIGANIAEGFGRYHTNDKIRFFYNSRGSISECMNHLYLAKGLGYLEVKETGELLGEMEQVKMMLNGLIRSLRNTTFKS